MKVVLLLVLTTLVGAAITGVGIAGAAGAFDDDESDSSSSSSSLTDFDECAITDPRFGNFTTYRVTGEAGTGTVVISCQKGVVEVSMLGSGITTEGSRTVALWLYNNRRDAVLIGANQQQAGDETTAITGPLPSGSQSYKKIVVTEGRPSTEYEEPEKPGKVILKVEL